MGWWEQCFLQIGYGTLALFWLPSFLEGRGEWCCAGELWEEAKLLAVLQTTRSLLNLGDAGLKHCFALFRVSLLGEACLPLFCED